MTFQKEWHRYGEAFMLEAQLRSVISLKYFKALDSDIQLA